MKPTFPALDAEIATGAENTSILHRSAFKITRRQ
jgi:hypothetical protein